MVDPLTSPPTCPNCGSTFTIDEGAECEVLMWKQGIGTMPRIVPERRACVVAFCDGCEYLIVMEDPK